MDFLDTWRTIRSRLVQFAAQQTRRYTIQFYLNNSEGNPDANASGVLLKYEERHFVITAAHVIAGRYRDVFVILDDIELVLGGKLFATKLTHDKHKCDQFDIAVMELDHDSVAHLAKSHDFLEFNQILFNHESDEEGLYLYLIYGYPATRTKVKHKSRTLAIQPFSYVCNYREGYPYARRGLDFATNLAVGFHKRVRYGGDKHLQNAPKLNGISGCGIWRFDGYTRDGVANPKLIGIVTCHDPASAALITTRIDVIAEYMRLNFKLPLAPSTKFTISV